MASIASISSASRNFLKRLKRDTSGLALIEFAYTLPIFIGLGFYGVEVANLAITQMKMSQVALNMADNASRIGTLDASLGAKEVSEAEINDVFQAAAIQAGHIDVFEDGRSVLSSLEINALGGQTIQWQRCKGKSQNNSDYGGEGTGESNTSFTGMGGDGNQVQAAAGSAVMFVELTYEYQPLFGDMFIGRRLLRQEAAYTVRDNRDLGDDPLDNVAAARKSTCDKYDDILPQTSDAEIAAAAAGSGNPPGQNGNGPGNDGNGGGNLCVLNLVCL
ncbi:MAG: hypothetical protein R3E02_05030 [Blastomonas sp.]